jgi:hypothetical protein
VSATALVIIPTHDHALLLPHAVRSAQTQTFADLEIAVIGDGVGDDTRDALAPFLRNDPRIVFHDRPKAGRTGEPHRHEVLGASDARWVTYLCDDDLLLPCHVEVVVAALADHDLVHPAAVQVHGDGVLRVHQCDMSDPGWRALELAGHSVVSLTGIGHRMEAYRRLPAGWRTTPPGLYTDQYMVQQFLAEPWCRARAFTTPTCVTFPSPMRLDRTAAERADELASWAARLVTPEGVSEIVALARDQCAVTASLRWRELIELREELEHTRATMLEASRAEVDDLRDALATAQCERDDLRRALAAAEHERDALRATRTVRTRDALVRVTLLRRLLARRGGAG